MSETVYAWESLRELMKEPNLAEMLREHYETSHVHKTAIPLDVDWRSLLQYDDQGILKTCAARRNGEFAGYMQFWLYPHPLFHKTKRAIQGAWNSIACLAPSLRMLKELGIEHVVVHTKNHVVEARPGIAEALKRCGFAPIDTVWSLVL